MKYETVKFKRQPKIIGAYSIVGPKEGDGNFRDYFDYIMKNDLFGEKTFEKAERKMIETAITGAIQKAKLGMKDINVLVAGDLLNQIISSSYAARAFDFPYLGVYGACSTMAESIAVASILVDGGYFENVVCCTASHFSTAERQYRFPLELGNQRPPVSQWTVTGAGSCVLSQKGKGPRVTMATFGKVIDWGIVDVNNMGAAMAPAASKVILAHLHDTGRRPEYYDLILTGDLGVLGSRILKDLLWESGTDVFANHDDCGAMIYARAEDEFQGGSGAGCSAVVFGSYILRELAAGRLNKVLFVATGALLSTVSSGQGESIPCIAHAVAVENDLS